jgi:hypothetical protein
LSKTGRTANACVPGRRLRDKSNPPALNQRSK